MVSLISDAKVQIIFHSRKHYGIKNEKKAVNNLVVRKLMRNFAAIIIKWQEI